VPTVTAVVVTYNRADLLAECLDALAAQTHGPERIVVVDNASTDETASVLAQRAGAIDVVSLQSNTGGAGGFAAGLAEALTGGCDAVWLLDDDTIPQPDALAELVRARSGYPGGTPAVVASRVVWTDGRDHPMNTPRTLPRATRDDLNAAASVGARPVRSASFVSILVDAATAAERGLPVAAYFLWNDDFEYTTRLIRGGIGLYVPTSVVVHKTRVFGNTDTDPGGRFYYEVRNKAWMFTCSRSLSPPEKVAYGGSTLTRWIRTFIDSPDRATLRDALRRGLVDAWTAPPRRTEDVLAEAAEPRP
jgi:rhamnopyranosyl-N-acetylglucosaminyl-diphospho-decaprenol beta-1,3/1,4-galactofuranosyltransferase